MEAFARQLLFPFGQLKAIASGVEWVSLFVPEKRKYMKRLNIYILAFTTVKKIQMTSTTLPCLFS